MADAEVRVKITGRCALEGIDRSRLVVSPASFDGEDLASRLARRQRNWIGEVHIAERRS